MKAFRVMLVLAALAFVHVLLATPALADGLIIIHHYPPDVRPPIVVPPRHYPFAPLAVEYHHVNVTIKGQVAVTEVDQVFYNPNNVRLEGDYVFPIPKGGQIDKFAMDVNGKEVEAELLDAGKARKIYEDIVRKMKDPALLEYADRGMFKVHIFPIEPHGKKQVKLRYTQVLTSDAGLIGYNYPLNTEKFSSQPVKDVSVKVSIEADSQIKALYSPSHQVEINRHGPNKAVVGFEAKNQRPDTDFQLYFSLKPKDGGDIGLSLLASTSEGDKDGYFMLLASPGVGADDKQIVKKDVVFVLDTSGSMAGEKLEQAKRALRFCIANLNKGDRFQVIRFSTEAEALFDHVTDATKANRDKAEAFVKDLKPIGGTAIAEALTRAVETITWRDKGDQRPAVVIFLTDGRPTIGTTNEDEIVAAVTKAAAGATVRVFSFGIGTDVNTHLLDRITEKTKAFSQYVLPTEDIEVKVSSFYARISHPVLADLKLSVNGVKVSKLYPAPLPDLFRGDQLVLFGRYEPSSKGNGATDAAVILEGNVNGKATKIVFETKFPAAGQASENDFIPRLWATRRVGYLLDEIRLHGQSNELRDEVTRLARTYGIVTPYTAYLIVEDEAKRNVPRLSRSLQEFEGRTEELEAAGRGLGSYRNRKSGATAVADARSNEALKQADNFAAQGRADREVRRGQAVAKAAPSSAGGEAPAAAYRLADADGSVNAATQSYRFIKGRAFYQNGQQWIDAQVPTMPDAKRVRVQFNSDEYFELIRKHKEALQWLSAGKNVQLALGDTVYDVYE